jgi:hypothetical protein
MTQQLPAYGRWDQPPTELSRQNPATKANLYAHNVVPHRRGKATLMRQANYSSISDKDLIIARCTVAIC